MYHVLLAIYSNCIAVLHLFRDIVACAVYTIV